MTNIELYIERREQGDYAVRRPGSKMASAVRPTKEEAIQSARAMNPKAIIYVERICFHSVGGRDKWRKVT